MRTHSSLGTFPITCGSPMAQQSATVIPMLSLIHKLTAWMQPRTWIFSCRVSRWRKKRRRRVELEEKKEVGGRSAVKAGCSLASGSDGPDQSEVMVQGFRDLLTGLSRVWKPHRVLMTSPTCGEKPQPQSIHKGATSQQQVQPFISQTMVTVTLR